jgi:signal transduction histidine kinase
MATRRILVVGGDYELHYQTKQALGDLGFSVQGAYSHRDALYVLKTGDFDALIVDSAMHDRMTGQKTIAVISHLPKAPPLVAYKSPSTNGKTGAHVAHRVTMLDDTSLRQAVLSALNQSTNKLNTQLLPVRDDADYWDVAEVQTLLALTRSLTEVLDLSEVLNRVVEAARQLSNADEGMILLPDGDTAELYLRAKIGVDNEIARNFRVRTQDTIAGQVFSSGQPILIGARGPQKLKTEYFVNSLLYVPILLKGEPIGVLGVNNRNKHDLFNTHHESLLLNLASYAAIAIENARIHGQSVRRARELKALVDASTAINASLSMDRMLPTICEQLVRALGVSQAEIYEWDKQTDGLYPLARVNQTVWRSGVQPHLTLHDLPATQYVLQNRAPHLISATDSTQAGDHDYLRSSGGSSVLILPILAQDDVFGVLFAFYTQTPSNLPSNEFMQRAQVRGLEILINLLDRGQKLNPHIIKLAEEVNELLQADWCEYTLLTSKQDALTLHLALGQATWLAAAEMVLKVSVYPDMREMLDTQNIYNHHLEGDQLTAGGHALLELTRTRALLALPLVYRGQTQGLVLCTDAENARVFTSKEIDLARAIVGQAATALENGHLVHDLEASLRELKDTQARLIQAERLSAMGELAAAVAHQINNPLTTIVLDTELMLLDAQHDSENQQALLAISRAGKRAASVVRRLLAAVRTDNSNTPPAPVDVKVAIEDTIALVRAHIERDGIRLILELPTEPLPPVISIPGELEDIWLNLVLNAHDALKGCQKPTIGLQASLSATGEQIRVVVQDNGPGIPPEVRDEVFKPFFTTKPVGEGTGLGLHICRQVIERVGGEIALHTQVGQGTTFVVTLPTHKGEH